ncbi:MAG: hypothetical protein IPL90_01365 [Holophagales bacterium]|nr:hypothetical protein [Holophagales bacterium]
MAIRIPDDAPDPAQMALYATWSPTRRWARAVQLRAAAWELKTAFCRQENPGWTEDQIVTEVRRQFLHARG